MADDPRPPQGIDRRKVLLGLGFGLANAAVLRQIGASRPTSATTAQAATQVAGASESAPSTTVGDPTGTGPTEPASVEGAQAPASDTVFDQVIVGGRVMDPESGYDRVANVGILAGAVAAISTDPLTGTAPDIDASGLVVAPGFIDILSYAPNGYGEWFKISDGVTTNLGMHGLRFDADAFHDRWTGEGSPVHFGGAVHSSHVRESLGYGIGDDADDGAVATIAEAVEAQLRAGYLGVHAQPEYSPGVDETELIEMGRVAARLGVPLTVHARYSDNLEPGTNLEATEELVRVARETGAWVHVEHINSTGGTGVMTEALGLIESARSEGLTMTACIYPYTFWATTLQTARYQDWQEKYGISYGDLQVAGTDERLTEATFQAAYEANALTAAYAIPEADNVAALQKPWVMLGSDAILEPSHNNHPRSTGCFARLFGTYVRDQGVLGLMDALAKATILPAQLVSGACPAMQRKGRLQIGADADVCVFDPATIADRSTIADPAQRSAGISWVLVDGRVVQSPDGVDETVRPGRAMRSEITA